MSSVIRIKPYQYIHVLDQNSLVTRVISGPATYTRQEHEKVVFGPEDMIKIPPRHYITISNPAVRNAKLEVQFDAHGNPEIRSGDEEIRFEDTLKEPFPLYPGESVSGKLSPLPFVSPNTALRLKATRDFKDSSNVEHNAGDEWIFEGPATYYPRIEVQIVENIKSTLIKQNEALKLRARIATTDKLGQRRNAGEEWLVRDSGSYIPGVDEEIIGVVKAYVLTEKKALQLKALRPFTDVYGKKRRAGEEWLVTSAHSSVHIPDVDEAVVVEVSVTTLSNRQYCVVIDPADANGKNQLGKKELRVGEVSFFLQPGERLESGIKDIHVLGEDEALLLKARLSYDDTFEGKKVTRKPGDRWMIYGPTDYVPPVEVEIVEKRRKIPLDDNEGIYIRDIKTGKVRSVYGESYMLQPHEELWEKELSPVVEDLLESVGRDSPQKATKKRDKTRVVCYRAPHNSAVQIYDYKEKKSRVVFGPELIMLGPDEQFSVLSLSGGTPKKEGVIKTIAVFLGPDFMTDVVTVETADHARLALKLAYNWEFKVQRDDQVSASRIFHVSDFVGTSCKSIASRVRGAVASNTFDYFHKNSADIIRAAVFGKTADSVRENLIFEANNLTITNIDIQSVEPVDSRTRDSLQKSVQLAIEITTNSQEASARHEAQCVEQIAKGKLERQKIVDEAAAENARRELLELQSASATVEASGQATAEANAKAKAAKIEAEMGVEQAKLRAEAHQIEHESQLAQKKARQTAEIGHQKSLNELEVAKSKDLAQIETLKFQQVVKAIGPETIQAIAQAGPELQAKLLQGLGLQGFMITDGNSPINLFNTANGLIGGMNRA